MSEQICASNHPVGYWPKALDVLAFKNQTYNVIVYELDDGFAAFTADAFGMNGEGASVMEALDDLKLAIETRAIDGHGGVFAGSSSFEYQDELNKRLESMWHDDGVRVFDKTRHVMTVFSEEKNSYKNVDARKITT